MRCAVVVIAVIAVLPLEARAQPPVGATLRPDGPGRYVIVNSLGQVTGALVEVSPGHFRFRDSRGALSDWSLKKRADGGWDYTPDPFHRERKSQ